ncbi:phosphoenolpyruvate synthase [Novosphingobium sp.]|uniref:phosphoenolpyruvate synthase n=1 Tax=Novosphingobium sp. TaxID=1874826 RepID=UPI0025D7D5CA|nr:phosphoenolpyruvate synthase [Novosphingobium sp.]
MANSAILWFEDIGIEDVPSVGGKNASLGEMVRALARSGVRVPFGFATTAAAFRSFVSASNIEPAMREQIERYHMGKASLQQAGGSIRDLILGAPIPEELNNAICGAYEELAVRVGVDTLAVAVRSSATAEDLPGASFAGQHETFLNVTGHGALLDACRRCYASLFTDRAISYRDANHFDHFDVALSIGVQQMVRADLGGSGVIFTIDTETGFPRVAIISAAWGLGETVVQGSVDPDRYVVFKPLLDTPGISPIIEKTCGAKAIKMVYDQVSSTHTRITDTSSAERRTLVLGDNEVLELARWAVAVEKHYGCPMDLEWARDGNTGYLYLLQARPETVQSELGASVLQNYTLKTDAVPILTGAAVGSAVAAGKACVIRDASDIARFPEGAILVTANTDPDWVPVMKRAAGIVTDHGGSTSHAAIVSRELGVPAIVGTGAATTMLHEGQEITISCAAGEEGKVFAGLLEFEHEEIDLGSLPETRTQVMVNLAEPGAAFKWWRLPAKGVGLARMEFIINTLIRIHPMALLHPDRLDRDERRKIAKMTSDYPSPPDYFVERLAQGIARLAAPYHPQPAIVRLSDFKTNEYAHLIGGKPFEPAEENPMLGWRGASRYYDERYREGFALECRALRRVREDLGFTNVVIMVPFCRTPAEADEVLETMAANGLKRGQHGLEVYMMCEIPSNVILAEEFAKRFDGFSIGSNDLTQLILGVDRDSELIASLFDERDAAVTIAIADAVIKAHKSRIKIGICGQAPSDFPEFAAFLVHEGIDSISLNPDSFVRTLTAIAAAERALCLP